jgi:hypothetical protein
MSRSQQALGYAATHVATCPGETMTSSMCLFVACMSCLSFFSVRAGILLPTKAN